MSSPYLAHVASLTPSRDVVLDLLALCMMLAGLATLVTLGFRHSTDLGLAVVAVLVFTGGVLLGRR